MREISDDRFDETKLSLATAWKGQEWREFSIERDITPLLLLIYFRANRILEGCEFFTRGKEGNAHDASSGMSKLDRYDLTPDNCPPTRFIRDPVLDRCYLEIGLKVA